MSSPSNRIEPAVGCRVFVRRLKQVVLPAPLGPIRAWIDPRRILRSTLLTALKPPKTLVSPLASSAKAVAPPVSMFPSPGPFAASSPRQAEDCLGQDVALDLVRAPEDGRSPRVEIKVHRVHVRPIRVEIVGEARLLAGDGQHLFGDPLIELRAEQLQHGDIPAELTAGAQHLGEAVEGRAEVVEVETQPGVA